MSDLSRLLQRHVNDGSVAGAVALLSRGGRVEVAAEGHADLAAGLPMARDSIFRTASITKPVTAAAALLLVEDGRLALDAPVGRWLPELAGPRVVRTPSSPLEDTVPAARPITVEHLLTSRAGYGFPSDFALPAVAELFAKAQSHPLDPQNLPAPDEWMATLAEVPLLHHPGEAWLYNTPYDILGVLIARASGQPFPEFLAERLLAPLGMADTGFAVPAADLDRFTVLYATGPDGRTPMDERDGLYTTPPAFPSGAGGLVSTVDDWARFGRMLLDGGSAGGHRVLSAEAVRLMTTDRLTPAERKESALFLEGQGWGMGGSVDVEAVDRWNVAGRYGWVGGSGTSAHVVPATGTTAILMTQQAATGPSSTPLPNDFWTLAAAF